MPDVPDFAAIGQDFVSRAVDLVPTPSEVVERVTATANELLTLSQEVQNKVISALTSNA